MLVSAKETQKSVDKWRGSGRADRFIGSIVWLSVYTHQKLFTVLIYTLSGSSRSSSSNRRLLESLSHLLPQHDFVHASMIAELPLFQADLDRHPWPPAVLAWRTALTKADALVICTPEYLHNLPALIKNALEWLASSGELVGKPVLPITFTPHPPRGERTMQSLTWSLQALDAKIVTQLPLHQKDVVINEEGRLEAGEAAELLTMAVELL